MTTDIAENIAEVLGRIRAAEVAAGRARGSVTLLAVSKTHPAEAIRRAAECGLREFGESYVQEALPKLAALADLDLTWHFIGPLQSNKTRAIAQHFHWVHSLDRIRIARRLSGQRPAGLPPLNVCLQVNLDAEPGKAGIEAQDLPDLAAEVSTLPGLRLRGLMAIPRARSDRGKQRAACARLRGHLESLRRLHPDLDTLSMGMSADLEAAVLEGSTLVRVGTALFGARPPAG